LLAATQINLTGLPLTGLQIMGVLETRNIDFDNVIVLSMNERIFPRKTYTKSIIPTNLRAGYMMMTQDEQEGAYAYHFARLISRAKNVKLIYDSRVSTGTTTGEVSRYITQLRYLYGEKAGNITSNSLDLPMTFEEKAKIVVTKNDQVLKEIDGFKPGGNLRLSASALKTLKKCGLKFYLEYVKNLRGTQEIFDYITEAEYGSIVHKTVEILYSPYKGKQITAEVIDEMLSGTRVADTINKVMQDMKIDFNVEASMLAKIIEGFISRMLQYEKQDFCKPSYTFVDAEMGVSAKTWKITDDIEVNFTMSIDRVDRLPDGKLRFIDYKTGGDKIEASKIASLFEGKNAFYTDAIFQLLVYCEAYAQMTGFDGDIVPYIYPFRTMTANKGLSPITIGKEPLTTYKQVSDEFMSYFVDLIKTLFEEDTPFVQTDNDQDCSFCPFMTLCGRNPRSY
jgi:hypothetical protein